MNRDDDFRNNRFYDDQFFNNGYHQDPNMNRDYPPRGDFDRDYNARMYDEFDSMSPQHQQGYNPQPRPMQEGHRPDYAMDNLRDDFDQPMPNVIITSPTSYSDVKSLIDCLKSNQAIIVDFEKIDDRIAQRILDYFSGALYALGGSHQRISESIFLITPGGMKIKIPINIEEQVKQHSKKGFKKRRRR